MAKQTIDLGTGPDTGTGDPARTAFTKTNDNFTQLFANVIAVVQTSNFVIENASWHKVDTTGGAIAATLGIDVDYFRIGDFEDTWTNANKFSVNVGSTTFEFDKKNSDKEYVFIKVGSTFRIYNEGVFIDEGDISGAPETIDVSGNSSVRSDSPLTPGSILLVNSDGEITEDNTNLFWDDINKRLGLGTPAPTRDVEIKAKSGFSVSLLLDTSDPNTDANLVFGSQGVEKFLVGYDASPEGLRIFDLVAGETRFFIDTSGNVGIGTNTPDKLLHVAGDAHIDGNLIVDGTKFINNTETVNISDNHLYLNAGHLTTTNQTGGLVVNRSAVATGFSLVSGTFTAGVAAVSNPSVSSVTSGTFATGDLIQVSDSPTGDNDGVFEVLDNSTTTMTIRGIGTTSTVEDFTDNQFVAQTGVNATITKINVSVLRSGTGGDWEQGRGSSTGIVFNNLSIQSGTLTTGSVLFVDATGRISQDNANFFWDDTNNRLGINQLSPGFELDVTGSARVTDTIHTNNLRAANIQDSISNANAQIQFGGASKFISFDTNGAERMRLNSVGDFGLGTDSPIYRIQTVSNDGDSYMASFEQNPTSLQASVRYVNTAPFNTSNSITHDFVLNTSTTDRTAARLRTSFTNTTDADRTSRFEFITNDAGSLIVGMTLLGSNLGIGVATPLSKLSLPLENDATTPTLSFGDGDTGLYEISDDVLGFTFAATLRYTFSSSGISFNGGNRPQISNLDASATAPNLIPKTIDLDTGIGSAGLDQLSLIAGGVELMRLTQNDASADQITSNSEISITIADTVNSAGLTVNQNDTTNNPNAATIINTGTGSGLFIDQNGNGIALDIDAESTTANVIRVFDAKTTTGNIFSLTGANALTTGRAAFFESNSPSTGARNVVECKNTNSSAINAVTLRVEQNSAANALHIDQNADGVSLSIDSEATTANIIDINAPTTTTGQIIDVNANSLTTGRILNLTSNSSSTGVRDLVRIVNDNTLATNTTPLRLIQDAAQQCLFIDQNGNGSALVIDSEATTVNVIHVLAAATTTGSIIRITDANALTTGRLLSLASNSADTTARALIRLVNDNALSTGTTCLEIVQDAANQVVSISQNAASSFIDYRGTAAANATDPISTLTTSGATTNHLQIELNGVKAWVACSIIDPS